MKDNTPATEAPAPATLITGGRILTPFEEFSPGELLINRGKIVAVGRDLSAQTPPDATRIDASGLCVTPGFIDLHTQGTAGFDVWDGTAEALAGWSLAMARFGTTSFQITTGYLNKGYDFLVEHLDCPRETFPGAEPLGVYLESPFCSAERRGGISEKSVSPVSVELLDEIQAKLGDRLHMMTVAPEREGALEIITELDRRGIIPALGHTACDYETALRAIDAGVTHVTHCFNTMPSIHHRAPGPLVATLLDERVSIELICDGIHIHPAVIEMAVRLKAAGKVCVVTDSVRAAGLGDGDCVFGQKGRSYTVKDGAVRLPDGTLAGGTLTMNRGLKNVMAFAGLSVTEALPMLTANPAGATRVGDRKGRLKPGFDADVVIFDDDCTVHHTMVAGRTVYRLGS